MKNIKKRTALGVTALVAVTGFASPAMAFTDIICDPISQTCTVVVCDPVFVDQPDGTTQQIDVCTDASDFPFPS